VSTAIIAARDLVAGYAAPVVGPLSFALAPGEVLGLWGRNGCGKSTLLRALGGTTRVFAGALERAPGLTVSYQLQTPPRLPEMPFSGAEYLRYGGAGRAPPRRLAQWLGQRVDRLSGGQLQLLAVWAALGADADLVLLDEPTNNLDPAGEALLAEILRAERDRRGVLLVSHERGFLDAACDRVLELGQ
jgi:zinc transport system ATP-binding protein